MEVAALAPLWMLGLGYGSLVFLKAAGHERVCLQRGATMRPLVPLSAGMRAGLASLAVLSGAALQVGGELYQGALVLTVTVALGSFRRPKLAPRARGPGEWCKLQDTALLVDERGADPFDPMSRAARPTLSFLSAFVVLLALLAHVFADAALLLLADSLVFLPLLVVGHDRDLPKDSCAAARPWLLRLRARLLRLGVAVSVTGRRPLGRANVDEIRLVVVGPAATVGTKSVELGVAFDAATGGAFPEVLARVVASSPAAEKLLAKRTFGRAIPGRSADERVFTIPVPSRTEEAAAQLVLSVLSELAERRSVVTEFGGDDRRQQGASASPAGSALIAELTA